MNRRSMLRACFVAIIAVSLSGSSAFAAEPAAPTKRLLLLGQKPDGHPVGTHEYMPGQRILKDILERVPGLTVEIVQADDPWTDGPELLAKADGVVLFVSEGAKWISADPRRYEAFEKLAARGGGLSVIHWGCGTKDAKNIEPFTRLFGACHGGPDRKYKFTDFSVALPNGEHSICSGIKPLELNEEFYFALKRSTLDGSKLTPLAEITNLPEATTMESRMVSWAYERPDHGRAFGYTGLHYHKNWDREECRRLVVQGIAWTMKLEIPKDGIDAAFSRTLLETPPVTKGDADKN
jgi:hypothetical protein